MLDDAEVTDVRLEIRINGVSQELRWSRDQPLLEALLDAGVSAPSSCRAGKCGACVCTIIEGKVEMLHNEILEEDDLADGYILGCQARPTTSHVKITFD